MTRQFLNGQKCKQCGVLLTCPNCGTVATPTTPFSDWLRLLPYPYDSQNFDNNNLDFIWFRYRDGWLVTIEEKRHGGIATRSQRDTHQIIAQLLSLSSGSAVQTMRGIRPIEYRGHYEVTFENTTPENSSWIRVNGIKADRRALLMLLATGQLRVQEALSSRMSSA